MKSETEITKTNPATGTMKGRFRRTRSRATMAQTCAELGIDYIGVLA